MPSAIHNALLARLEAQHELFERVCKPHISVIKKETPVINRDDWGKRFVGETVTILPSNIIRCENGYHYWIDCYSPGLCAIREHFGLPTLKTEAGIYLVNFHLTIATRIQPTMSSRRPHYRLTPQSHIDIETGMQHL